MKKPLVIYPFLFGLFPILFIFSHNVEQVSFFESILPLAIVLACVLLSVFLLQLFLKDKEKAGIIVTVFLVLFFSYGRVYGVIKGGRIGGFVIGGHRYLLLVWGILFLGIVYYITKPRKYTHSITSLLQLFLKDKKKAGIIVAVFLVLFFSYCPAYDAIKGWRIGSFIIGGHRYLLPVCGIPFLCIVYYITKTRRCLHNITRILNVMGIYLAVIPLVNIGVYGFRAEAVGRNNSVQTQDKEANSLKNETMLRDIYYIILDGYASSSTLEEIYDFDNHEFTDYLTEKGFYIAWKSRSNYPWSYFSMMSSLNMEYLDRHMSNLALSARYGFRLFKNNKVMNFLRERGYRFIHFSSGWEPSDRNEYADVDFRCGWLNEFNMLLIETTMLCAFERYLIANPGRKKILRTFFTLAQVDGIEGPRFVFAHIVLPHPPFLFGANGEPISEVELKLCGYWDKEKYLNQLIFTNEKIKVFVSEILSKSEIPPIVILQADHGSRSTFGEPKGDLTDPANRGWVDPTEDMLKEGMRIFNAYYLPSDKSGLLYDSITPVNTFRIIFNSYFNTNYELLDDRSYFSPHNDQYKYINVTDKVAYN